MNIGNSCVLCKDKEKLENDFHSTYGNIFKSENTQDETLASSAKR